MKPIGDSIRHFGEATWLIVRRFGAFAIDWLIFCLVSLPIALFYWFGGGNENGRIQTILLWLWLIYYVMFEWVYGATIGKFVFRLTVKRADGTNLSFVNAVCRTGLIFIIPIVLSGFIEQGILFLYPTSFGASIANAFSTAIIAAVPLSIIIFGTQSVADVLLHTYVIPVSAVAKATSSTRRWILVGLFPAFVGIGTTWLLLFSMRMMYGTANDDSHKFVNTFPSDLIPDDQILPGERKTTLDFQGSFIRQRQKKEPDKSIELQLYGSATSYDELLGLKTVASHMAELPDAERPKCMTVRFTKEFEAVLASFQHQHEMMVCDVPKGLPYQATIIDRRLSASWQFRLNTAYMLPILIGEYGNPVQRLVP